MGSDQNNTGLINRLTTLSPVDLMLVAVFITGICFSPTLLNDWTNWDDGVFVLENPQVATPDSLSAGNLKYMFTDPGAPGIYHPIAILSLAIDYKLWETNAFGFHLTSLLLHLANTALVFILFLRLSGHNAPGQKAIAFFGALLFGIHPMHIESVAWISARKDVLCCLFFLACCLFYMRYRETAMARPRFLFYSLVLLSFVLALLAKGIAITLPLILLLIDYLQGDRSFAQLRGRIIDKLPLILVSVLMIWLIKHDQQNVDSLLGLDEYPYQKTIFIGIFNTISYLIKAVVPYSLSPFHPFPFLEGIDLPTSYYLSIIPFLILLMVLFKAWKHYPALFFGLAFFLVSIAPLLQILPFGKAVQAERYTYIAYIGLFYCFAFAIQRLLSGHNKPLVTIILTIWLGALSVLSFQYMQVWKNSETLWSAVIKAYPEHYFAWQSRGQYHTNAGNYPQAQQDLNEAIALNPNFSGVYFERGRLFMKRGELFKAIEDFSATIERNPNHARAYLNRGICILQLNDNHQVGLFNINKAIEADPNYALAWFNRGMIHKRKGRHEAALADVKQAVELAPHNALFQQHYQRLANETRQ